jgi:putative pyruvate formate lyase activating enzyme
MPAIFKITEKVPVQFDPSMQLEELREIHKKGIEEYRKLRENLELEAINALVHKNASDRLLLLTEIFLKHPKANPSLLDLKGAIVDRIMENCHCCGWRCGVNRKAGENGLCRLIDISNLLPSSYIWEKSQNLYLLTRFFLRAVLLLVSTARTGISLPVLKQELK